MDIAEKIRAEIQLHRAELERLETALSVIEQYGLAKPAKAPPLITVRKRVEPAAKSKAKSNKFAGKAPKGTLPVKAMILQALDKTGGAMTAKDFLEVSRPMGRADNSVYGGLDSLVKQGVILRDGSSYMLPGKQTEAPPPNLEPGETGQEGNSEAA